MTPDDEPDAGDTIEQGAGSRRFGWLRWLGFQERDAGGTGWRPSRGAAVLATVTLLAGLAAGYAAGKGTSGGSAAPAPRPSAAPSPSVSTILRFSTGSLTSNPLAVQQGMAWCSMQFGTNLLLGIDVTNQSRTEVFLTGLRPVLPAGKSALSEVSWSWGPCAANTYGPSQSPITLAPGATAWLSVTLKVHVRCPGPYPVQFRVSYFSADGNATAMLSGFTDLSQVRYSGCSP